MQHKDMQRGMTRRTFVALAGALAVATSLPRTVMAAGAGSSAADSATDSAADGGGSAFGFIPKRGKTTVTDDCQAVELAGEQVRIIESRRPNFKITVPEDLQLAAALLK